MTLSANYVSVNLKRLREKKVQQLKVPGSFSYNAANKTYHKSHATLKHANIYTFHFTQQSLYLS